MKKHKIKQHQGFKSSQTSLFLYTYGQYILLQWKVGLFSPSIFKPLMISDWLCAFHLLYNWYQRRSDFPQGHRTSNSALPDVGCSSIFTKGRELLLLLFSTHIPLQDFMALVLPHWQAIHFSYHLPGPDFLQYRLQLGQVFLLPEWKLRKFLWRIPKHRFKGKRNRGRKYISRVKDKQFLEAKHLFQIQITRTKSIYSLKNTVASLQATLSTAVRKLNKFLFQSQYTKN